MSGSGITGSCLCGRVVFLVEPPFLRFVHCHCSRCRKSSGTAHSTNIAVRVDQLRWVAGEEAVHYFHLPAAARFGKSFCSVCGCAVPRRLPETEIVVIPAGSMDEPLTQTPSEHIHWGSRSPWGCQSAGLPVHAGQAAA